LVNANADDTIISSLSIQKVLNENKLHYSVLESS